MSESGHFRFANSSHINAKLPTFAVNRIIDHSPLLARPAVISQSHSPFQSAGAIYTVPVALYYTCSERPERPAGPSSGGRAGGAD